MKLNRLKSLLNKVLRLCSKFSPPRERLQNLNVGTILDKPTKTAAVLIMKMMFIDQPKKCLSGSKDTI